MVQFRAVFDSCDYNFEYFVFDDATRTKESVICGGITGLVVAPFKGYEGSFRVITI